MVDSIPVTLVGAGATAAAGYVFGLITDIRKTKLNFVNTQIEKLYGPPLRLHAGDKQGVGAVL
jgi:hypothetical protein